MPGLGRARARLEQLLREAALEDVVLDNQAGALEQLQQVLVAARQTAVLLATGTPNSSKSRFAHSLLQISHSLQTLHALFLTLQP